MRRNSGFSLVELLTVIAIIAILASIIFPVMTAVKNNAKRVQCQTNLHNIAMALKMFQQDNRKFPSSLAGYYDGALPSPLPPFERSSLDALYPEYVKSIKAFHCPLSPTTDTSAIVDLQLGSTESFYYAYDSYDVYSQGLVTSAAIATATAPDLRYTVLWALTVADVTAPPLPPYPPGATDTPELKSYDFKRQLRFRSPGDDTVVTWCAYHDPSNPKAKIPVLFLDGHADLIAKDVVDECRWRVQPTK